MSAFFFYFAKTIVCSAMFAGCYWFVLRNTRLFHWNRLYILTSVALSVIIPLINIQIPTSYAVMPAITDYVIYFAIPPAEVAAPLVQPETPSFSWTWLAFIAYLSVVFFLMAREILYFACILRLKRRSVRMHTPETVLYCTDDASAPFTFFRTIFWKKGISVDSDESRCMLRHELAHVRHRHSWDKALMQLLCCMFWMNPFFIMFRRELELVHEFAADNESAVEEFSSLILCTLYPKNYNDFVSRFFQSPIKRRIFMITKKEKSSMNMLRKMSIVPVALVAIYLFACTSSDIIMSDIETKNDIVFLYATMPDENKPSFNGMPANEGFREYVNSIVVYPKAAMENGITGRVFVDFVIDTDGSVTDARILRGVDPLLDTEALRVINSSPKWTPAEYQGVPVKVRYHFPFAFQLGSETLSESSRTLSESAETSNDGIFIFAVVDEKPLFNSMPADEGFREFVLQNLVFPSVAKENGITGRVFLEFVIDTEGSVTDVKILRGVDPLLDAEALRVARSSPKWTPGKQNGETVKVKFFYPFDFLSD